MQDAWEMVPHEVNAYFSPEENCIVFPAGILQPPFFSRSQPEFLSFGSFGAVAGHETTHAFDQAGRQYAKDGKLEDWWTNATVPRFEARRKCIVDQYAKYAVEDADGKQHFVQANFTNGEDSADAGGLNQAWRAWRDRLESDPKGERYDNALLPGLSGWTREQLFFIGEFGNGVLGRGTTPEPGADPRWVVRVFVFPPIAYAQGWARNVSPAEAVRRVRTDPHSPNFFRVIGPLSNNAVSARFFLLLFRPGLGL